MPDPGRRVLPQRRGGAEVERSLAAPPLSGRCAAVCGFAASLVLSRAWIERSAIQAEH